MYDLLAGLVVVEMSAYVAAPLAGMTLAQMGARVIKVEPVGGGPDAGRWPLAPGGQSLFWRELNKAKELLRFDFKQSHEQEAFLRLLDQTGRILVTNLPLPLSDQQLRERFPDLILVRVQGKSDGRSAVDYTIQPETGFPEITGPSDAVTPINSPLPMWDIMTGYMTAITLLGALRRREQTGQGAYATVALADVALVNICNLGIFAEFATSGRVRPRDGNNIYGAFGCDFETRDSRRLMIVAITRRQWQELIRALGVEDELARLEQALQTNLADEGNRYRHRKEVAEVLDSWFRTRTLDEIRQHLENTGVAWAPYRGMEDVLRSISEHQPPGSILERIEQPDIGPIISAGVPIRLRDEPRKPLRGAPAQKLD